MPVLIADRTIVQRAPVNNIIRRNYISSVVEAKYPAVGEREEEEERCI